MDLISYSSPRTELFPTPNPDSTPTDTNPKTRPRADTPKPLLAEVVPSQESGSGSKRSLSRTNTPFPDLQVPQSPVQSQVPQSQVPQSLLPQPQVSQSQPQVSLLSRTRLLLQHRSASFDVISAAPNVKPPPRPISLNVGELIKKNLDTPKRNDPRSFLKMHSTHSKLARKPLPRDTPLATAILAACAKQLQLE